MTTRKKGKKQVLPIISESIVHPVPHPFRHRVLLSRESTPCAQEHQERHLCMCAFSSRVCDAHPVKKSHFLLKLRTDCEAVKHSLPRHTKQVRSRRREAMYGRDASDGMQENGEEGMDERTVLTRIQGPAIHLPDVCVDPIFYSLTQIKAASRPPVPALPFLSLPSCGALFCCRGTTTTTTMTLPCHRNRRRVCLLEGKEREIWRQRRERNCDSEWKEERGRDRV